MNNSNLLIVSVIIVIAGVCFTGCNWLAPQHTITASSGLHGEINPDKEVIVMDGESQEFSIYPDDGWYTMDVTVDGNSTGALSRYTFINVTEDHEIHATFTDTISLSGYWSGPILLNSDEGYALAADLTQDDKNIGGNVELYYNGVLLSTYIVELTVNDVYIEGMCYSTDMNGYDIEVSALVNSTGTDMTGGISIPGNDTSGTFSITKNYYYLWELR